ncbi:MAG: ABC transporter permease [Chloroflexi bacterium]|uniref:Transport permease protein n=1 Tax=Candidatus Chlorohelix allophototropha TaxID=3003348 RepID=A0A8T7LVU3_9CHLR|nr:ABC transporter permease [Chloroflexota bacterium]WJW66186.1 ABC transporter permease [Chloroflexota bacterium L227-S17]
MKLISDTWLLFKNYLINTLRQPVWIIVALFTPICYLLLFGPLLEKMLIGGAPGTNALTIFTPGMLVMLGMFGSMFVGFSIIADLRAGVVERLRVTPVNRLAPLLARALRDALILLVQCVLLIAVAYLMGLKADFGGVLLSLILVIPMGIALASFSYALGLLLKSEDAIAPLLNFLTTPLLLLSGILLPLTFAPDWLQGAAKISPFYYVVNATRSLFVGDYGDSSVWIGYSLVIILAGLCVYWAANVFRRATA